MYTKQDLDVVFDYNTKRIGGPVFYVSPKGRVQWCVLNMDHAYYNDNLSRPVQTKQDLDQLKKQVKQEMQVRGMLP
jgi:isopentenyl diphosphate isomerase/L-lactate dehydrogenase-like FMN-dependent dehydrogenase